MKFVLFGPLSGFGLGVAVLAFIADQFTKWLILSVVNLDERSPVRVTSFLDFTMAWNEGVSYSLFATHRQGWLIALSLSLTVLLWHWLAKAITRTSAFALGLVIGGALGNALDRYLHGAVADFVHFHIGRWSWYIFNVADIAIVAGVVLMIYDSFRIEGRKGVPY